MFSFFLRKTHILTSVISLWLICVSAWLSQGSQVFAESWELPAGSWTDSDGRLALFILRGNLLIIRREAGLRCFARLERSVRQEYYLQSIGTAPVPMDKNGGPLLPGADAPKEKDENGCFGGSRAKDERMIFTFGENGLEIDVLSKNESVKSFHLHKLTGKKGEG